MAKLKLSAAGALAKKVLIPIIVKRLQNPAIKERIIDKLNSRLDIPGMSEADEKKLLTSVYGTLETVLLTLLDD